MTIVPVHVSRATQRFVRTVLIVALLSLGLLTLSGITGVGRGIVTTAHADGAPAVLPGESLWNSVPSFDFGSNDGVNWDTQYNMDVAPDAAPIQSALKAGHM